MLHSVQADGPASSSGLNDRTRAASWSCSMRSASIQRSVSVTVVSVAISALWRRRGQIPTPASTRFRR